MGMMGWRREKNSGGRKKNVRDRATPKTREKRRNTTGEKQKK